ncbi:MAG: UbiA family prenyltransferase [Luteolibacter sp.]|nr:UbiA family prenyltransferase [Luteolibacter sp.]
MQSISLPTLDQAPLVVDLDRSLLRVDLLHEALARLGLRSPRRLIRLAWRHRGSLAAFKTAVAEIVPMDPAKLPYEPRVIAHLREESARGRRLILATASPGIWAGPIAEHLGFFADVLASDGQRNLKRERKLAALRELLGEEPFAYLGDSNDDIPVFDAATGGRILAGSSPRPLAHLRKMEGGFNHIAPSSPGARILAMIRACRPVHWVKNCLIFVPAITSWGTYDPKLLISATLAFFAFSFIASAVYLVNDLADLAADRAHPDKRKRPLAAGLLPVSNAIVLAACLATAAFSLAAFTGPVVVGVLLLYIVLNAAYTIRLKEMPLADIALLSCFYLIRLMLGLAVLGLPQSVWFIGFMGCLFAELAHWKRYVEVITTASTSSKRRSYTPADANVLLAFGVGFSFTAAIVLTLYLRSDEISPVYTSPKLLAILAPILLLHNLGMWLEASRGNGASDPIHFVLKSRKFWAAGIAAAIVLAAARLLPYA